MTVGSEVTPAVTTSDAPHDNDKLLAPTTLPPVSSTVNDTLAVPGPTQRDRASSTVSESQLPPSPDHYIRDPHKLIAYIVPFPAPSNLKQGTPPPPLRFLIYTPPPPPLLKNDAERTSHKIQRRWQHEVREAHESKAKVASWAGVKSRVTKGVSWAVNHATTADLDFLTRIPRDGDAHHGKTGEGCSTCAPGEKAALPSEVGAGKEVSDDDDDDEKQAPTTQLTVKLEELVLIYPPLMHMTPEELRVEFINSLLRTKSKAQRDAVIATGLLPVTAALDWALVFCGWVFGGALEVDAVWAAASFRGAKTARSVTKRLSSTAGSGDASATADSLRLSFVSSHRADLLESYLLGQCMHRNPKRFKQHHTTVPPTEDVLQSLGWQLSGVYESKNWEDEAWERGQVLSDLEGTMSKAARAWDKWVNAYEKDPEKAVKR